VFVECVCTVAAGVRGSAPTGGGERGICCTLELESLAEPAAEFGPGERLVILSGEMVVGGLPY
jgi:hypothetical protein